MNKNEKYNVCESEVQMLNLNTNNHQNDIQLIVNALSKKSKKTLSRKQNALRKQAQYFSPLYRDFIYKIISNTSLKIENKYNDGYITPIGEISSDTHLKKRQKNKIYTDIDDIDTLPHELGHAVDFWFSHINTLTNTVVLSNNKTLKEIFDEEFENKQEEIYQIVMDEYKNIINSNINDKAYDVLIENMPSYLELQNHKCNLQDKELTKKRRIIQSKLYESGFVETYYLLYQRKCFSILNNKYSPILDALSSKYDFDGLFLDHHQYSYYQLSNKRPVQEFFANLFASKVTSKKSQFDYLITLLPKSYEAFEELFFIFYDHIQTNKRFIDVNKKGQ